MKKVPQINFVTSFYESPSGGLGRYERELVRGFDKFALPHSVNSLQPIHVPHLFNKLVKSLGPDCQGFLANHPTILQNSPSPTSILHYSHQMMGLAILHRRLSEQLRNRRSRIVVTVHDLFSDACRTQPDLCDIAPHVSRSAAVTNRLNLLGLRLADHIIADSHATAKDVYKILSIDENKLSVVHLGIDHVSPLSDRDHTDLESLRTKWSIPEDYRVILYVGSQGERKNLVTLMKAVQLLNHRGVSAILVVAGGERTQQSKIQAFAQEASHPVRYTGQVSEEELQALYRMAYVFAFPSRFEGFGFPVLEAMVHNCPVVASNVTSIPEVAGNAALLVDPLNVGEWAESLEKVLTDHTFARNLVERGKERIKLFSWEKATQETLAVYQTLLKQQAIV